ncbi:MAG: phospholipid carrier-dependent glycosyltransferase [Candidatus Zixiibacteriota bacterium]|nr:MAG: phospholipid carrier-dependent glycosyltransferase [candidate division Zixibacteria bacterium]
MPVLADLGKRESEPSLNASSKESYRHSFLILLLCCLPAIVIRLADPLRFPGVYVDEGMWSVGPKHALLLGNPLAYNIGHIFLSPFHYATTVALYWLFEPSLALSRLLSAAYGTGNILLTWLIARRFWGERTALLAALLVAYNSVMIPSSRMALLEQEVIFFILAATYFWFHPRPGRVWLAGLFLGFSLLVKALALAIVPALIAGQVLSTVKPVKLSLRLSRGQWFALGLAAVLTLAGYLAISRVDPEIFTRVWMAHSVKRTEMGRVGEAVEWRSYFHFVSIFIRQFPAMVGLSVVGLVLGLWRRRPGMVLMVAWPLAFFAMISLQEYRPERYYFSFIPALAILAALALTEIIPSRSTRLWKALLAAAVLLLCLDQMVKLAPAYREGVQRNPGIIAAGAYVTPLLEPGEPVFTTYEAAMFVAGPTICPPLGYTTAIWGDGADLELMRSMRRYIVWWNLERRPTSERMDRGMSYFKGFTLTHNFGSTVVWERDAPAAETVLK